MATENDYKYKFVRSTLKDDPKKFISAIFVVFLVYLFILYAFNPLYAMISLFLTISSLSEIFFTFKYTFFEKGLLVNRFFYKVKRDYSYYKKVFPDKNGIFLSPYRFKTRMEMFRGILLRIPEKDREEVMAFLVEKIETHRDDDNSSSDKEKNGKSKTDKRIQINNMLGQ